MEAEGVGSPNGKGKSECTPKKYHNLLSEITTGDA